MLTNGGANNGIRMSCKHGIQFHRRYENDSWEDSNWHDDLGLPDTLSRTVIRTGPDSTILIAVYKPEQLAEQT